MMSGISPVAGWLAAAGDAYETDNKIAQAKAITVNGATQTHSIHAKGDVDWVKFTLSTSSNLVVETNGSAGDTELRLYNSSGAQIAYNNDYNRYFSRISVSNLAAGTYYASVNEYGNNATISSYTLRATSTAVVTVTADAYETDNAMSAAKTITPNATAQTHSIHVAGDVDWVKFTLSAASNVVVTTGGSSGDTELTLYNGSGAQIGYNDDYNGTWSRIAASNLAAGTYYAKVNEFGNNATISSYTLQVTSAAVVNTSTNYMLVNAWGGAWTDADKSTTNTEDDLLCWAATTSNMLQWTGWGRAGGMTTADAVFTYYQNHWTDQGGHQYYGCDWWFDGTNTMQGVSGWAQVDVAGGGFFPTQNFTSYIHYSSSTSGALSTIDSYLRSGWAVGLGLSGPGGHAVTCWGFEFAAGSPTSYKGIYITDSDDNQSSPSSNYLKYYSVVQTNGRWYLQNYYGYNSWYISDVTGLSQRPSTVTSARAGLLSAVGRVTQSRFGEGDDTAVTTAQPAADAAVAAVFDEAAEGNTLVQDAEAVSAAAASVRRVAHDNLQLVDHVARNGQSDAWADASRDAAVWAAASPTQLRLISDAVFQLYL
jgi:hypothetical protein